MKPLTRILLSMGVLGAMVLIHWLDQKTAFPAHMRNSRIDGLAVGIFE